MLRRLRPSDARAKDTALFWAEPPKRMLRIVLDDELLSGSDPSSAEHAELLMALAAKSGVVAIWRFADDGPPPIVPWLNTPRGSAPVGWLAPTPVQDQTRPSVSHELTYADGDRLRETAIFGDLARGERATYDQSYPDLNADAAASRRHHDSLLMATADAANADLLVTMRPFLHSGAWPFADRVPICDLEQDIAVTGLFMRSRNRFLGWATPNGYAREYGKGTYYWVATRTMLPDGWQWFSDCVRATAEDDLTYLAQSVFERVKRALIARDHLLQLTASPQDNSVADDALTAMDSVLIFLTGASDASARVAHRALGLPSDGERFAGWQSPVWLKRVRAKHRDLADLFSAASVGADLLLLLTRLRNTIHGAGMTPMAMSGAFSLQRTDTMVSLPRVQAEEVVRVLDRQGWTDNWGLQRLGPDHFLVSPDAVVEHLFATFMPLLNEVLRLTPTESFNQTKDAAPTRTDDEDLTQPFAVRNQASLQLQVGLGAFSARPTGPSR